MTLSFFRALNPTSKKSGVIYNLEVMVEIEGRTVFEIKELEMEDRTIFENISHLSLDLSTIYRFLAGDHYTPLIIGYDAGCSKGALDYLIFPLIARKLIVETFLEERRKNFFSNALAWAVAIPLELVRISTAFALTLLLVPIVAVAHIMNFLFDNNEKTALTECNSVYATDSVTLRA